MDSWSPQPSKLRRSWLELKKLTWPERWFLGQAFLLLPLMVASLRLLGFLRLQSGLSGLCPSPTTDGAQNAEETGRAMARLISASAARIPFPVTCLPRSLTLWWMLRWNKIESEVRLGVRRGESGLEAHAWVEADGIVLNDRPDVHDRYAAFEPIEWPKKAKWL